MNNITSLKLKLNFGMISRLIGFRVALFVKPLTYVINKRIIENLIHNKNDITIKCKSICQITLELSLLNIESPKWIVLYFNNLIPSFTDNNPFPTRQFLLIKSPHIHHHHLESIYWIWHHVCISCRYIKSIFNPRTDLLYNNVLRRVPTSNYKCLFALLASPSRPIFILALYIIIILPPRRPQFLQHDTLLHTVALHK